MHEHLGIPDDEGVVHGHSDVLGISAHEVGPEAALVADCTPPAWISWK
jgi:hypothetical protein